LIAYADTQGGRWIRMLIVASLAAGGAALIALLWTSAGPHSALGRGVTLGAAIAGTVTSLFWTRAHWPGRTSSAVFVVLISIATSAAFLGGAAPLIVLPISISYTLICSYASMFHSVRLLTGTYIMGLGTIGVIFVRALYVEPLLAVVELGFVLVTIVGIPMTTHWWIRTLGVDVVNSDLDSLTGLLNRRAFYLHVSELIERHARDHDRFLVVVMIDLDRFKQLNDREGHAGGDRALVEVARALLGNTRQHAVVARIGGDEFLVADVVDRADKDRVLADRLCRAIKAVPPHVSASVGIVSIAMADLTDRGEDAIEQLIDTADAAMYEAKHAGGNQFRVTGWNVSKQI